MEEDTNLEATIIDIASQEEEKEIHSDEFSNEDNIAFLKRQIRELDTSTNCVFGNTTQGADGTVSITGIGFKPSLIKIRAWYQQDGKAGESNGIATTATNDIVYTRKFDGTNYTQEIIDNYIIYTFDNAGTVALRATLDSIDTDGFTMTFSNYIASSSIKYLYECYK